MSPVIQPAPVVFHQLVRFWQLHQAHLQVLTPNLAAGAALQALNSYVEQVARGITPRSTSVEFWVKDGEHLTRIDAQLPSTGSLGPIFFAFGLISEEELQAGAGGCSGGSSSGGSRSGA